jgi:hypothetical protein
MKTDPGREAAGQRTAWPRYPETGAMAAERTSKLGLEAVLLLEPP